MLAHFLSLLTDYAAALLLGVIYFKDGAILFDGGAVAMSEDCCCGGIICGPCDACGGTCATSPSSVSIDTSALSDCASCAGSGIPSSMTALYNGDSCPTPGAGWVATDATGDYSAIIDWNDPTGCYDLIIECANGDGIFQLIWQGCKGGAGPVGTYTCRNSDNPNLDPDPAGCMDGGPETVVVT